MAVQTERVRKIPTQVAKTGGKCSNLACMASNGNKVWALKIYKNKDNDAQDRSALYYGADINKSVAYYMSENDILGRGNGMTVDSKYVSVGCYIRINISEDLKWDRNLHTGPRE